MVTHNLLVHQHGNGRVENKEAGHVEARQEQTNDAHTWGRCRCSQRRCASKTRAGHRWCVCGISPYLHVSDRHDTVLSQGDNDVRETRALLQGHVDRRQHTVKVSPYLHVNAKHDIVHGQGNNDVNETRVLLRGHVDRRQQTVEISLCMYVCTAGGDLSHLRPFQEHEAQEAQVPKFDGNSAPALEAPRQTRRAIESEAERCAKALGAQSTMESENKRNPER